MTDALWGWPEDGRLARVTNPASEYEGCLALVTAWPAGYFLVYVIEEDGPRYTDYLADFDEPALIKLEGLVWLDPDEDVRLEASAFGLRQHWREREARAALPWWRRPVRR